MQTKRNRAFEGTRTPIGTTSHAICQLNYKSQKEHAYSGAAPVRRAIRANSLKLTLPWAGFGSGRYDGECTGFGFAFLLPDWATVYASNVFRRSVSSIVFESQPSHGNTTGSFVLSESESSSCSERSRARYRLSGIAHNPSTSRHTLNAFNLEGSDASRWYNRWKSHVSSVSYPSKIPSTPRIFPMPSRST